MIHFYVYYSFQIPCWWNRNLLNKIYFPCLALKKKKAMCLTVGFTNPFFRVIKSTAGKTLIP